MRMVFGLGAAWILDGLHITNSSSVTGVLTNPQTLHMTSTEIGLIASIYLIGEVFRALIFGRLSDRLGRTRLLIVTLFLYLCGTGPVAFVTGHHTASQISDQKYGLHSIRHWKNEPCEKAGLDDVSYPPPRERVSLGSPQLPMRGYAWARTMNESQDPAHASSSPTDAVRLAERYVAAYNDRDPDAMLAVLDEKYVSYPTPLFGHRPHFGHAGVRAWWAAMMASSRRFDVVVREVRQIEPDRVAVLGAIHNSDSGRRLGPWSVIVRVRNGRIVESRSDLIDEEMS